MDLMNGGDRVALDLGNQVGLPASDIELLVAIGETTRRFLELLGTAVLMVGGAEDSSPPVERSLAILQFRPELLISLRVRRDGPAGNREFRGLPQRRGLLGNRRLAQTILERLSARAGLPARGVPIWPERTLELQALVGRWPKLAVLIEIGLANSPADELLMAQPEFGFNCACGLAEGILESLGVPVAAMDLPALLRRKDQLDQAVEQASTEVTKHATSPVDSPCEIPPVDPAPIQGSGPAQPPTPEAAAPAGGKRRASATPLLVTSVQSANPLIRRRERKRRSTSSPPVPTYGTRDANGMIPEPMVQGSNGHWVSQRAQAILQQRMAQGQDQAPQLPRIGADGRVHWPGPPPGWNPQRQ